MFPNAETFYKNYILLKVNTWLMIMCDNAANDGIDHLAFIPLPLSPHDLTYIHTQNTTVLFRFSKYIT